MAFSSTRSRKLPIFVTQEEFEKMFEEIIRKEKRTTVLKRNKLRRYRIAMLLGFEGGMRISEIVGLKNANIPQLDKENLSEISIRITGKGKKERIVPRPKRLNEAAKLMLPLKISRRALQTFTSKIGDEVLGKHISFHCVDKNTEILTDMGWKKYNEIKNGDDIFTYNLKKDKIELFKTREIFSKFYSGKMYHIKNKYIDSLVTPEHKIIAKYSTLKIIEGKRKDVWNSNKWNLIPLNEILSNKSLRQVKYKLSGLKSNLNNGKSIGKNKAGILGWILSDGCISKGGIIIQQSLSANSDINWIYEFINKDRTPNLSAILKLNKKELEMIYKNMMLGDGTKNSREYCGQNIKRIDLIRILACLLSKKTTIGVKKQRGKKYFRTYITEQNTCDIQNNIFQENYNGIVWCPSTPNGTFIARRNGTIFLTGNSLRHGFGSHLAGQGRPLHEIQMLMGHSRLDTTGLYTHCNPKNAVEGARDVF